MGNRVGVTGAEFLKTGAGARALGMGEAFTAVAEGAEGIYYNPAGLASLRRPSFHYSRTELLRFFHHDFAAYAHPIGHGALGVAFTRMSQDSLPLVTNQNATIGKFSPHSEAVTLGYAHRFAAEDPERSDRDYFRESWVVPGVTRPLKHERDPWQGAVSAGVALKVIHENIYEYSASAVAVDGGLIYHPLGLERLSLGLAFRNLGGREHFINGREPLPLDGSFGAAYDFRWERWRLLPSVEGVLPQYGRGYGKAGLEWMVPAGEEASASFRVGFNSRAVPDLGAVSGLTSGAGIVYKRFAFDFGFQPMAELGEAYRMSVAWKF